VYAAPPPAAVVAPKSPEVELFEMQMANFKKYGGYYTAEKQWVDGEPKMPMAAGGPPPGPPPAATPAATDAAAPPAAPATGSGGLLGVAPPGAGPAADVSPQAIRCCL